MRQQIRAIRRVSRKYSCSFSNIDWGFRLSQGDIASSFDEDDRPVLQHPSTTMDEEVEENVKEGQRSTIVSEGSTATMDTAASRIRVSHRTLVTALNSWKGSLRGMFVHVDESHHSDDGSDEEGEEYSVDTTSVTACTLTCLNDEKQPDCYSGEMEQQQQLHDEMEQQPAQQQHKEQETQPITDEALLEQWAESVTTFHKSTTSSTTAPVSHASSNIDDSERSTTLDEDMFLHWDGSLARCQRTSITNNNNTTDEDVISISHTTPNAISRVESSGSFAVDAEGFLHWDATSRR